MSVSFRVTIAILATFTLLSPGRLPAQSTGGDSFPRPSQQLKTFVQFVILTPRVGTGLKAQQWGPIFERMGATVRFRQHNLGEEPDIEESTRGTFRTVTVTGVMDAEGALIFPETSYDMSQAEAFGEWIAELKAFGAQGSPEGKPVWGLKETEFTEIYEALTPAVDAAVKSEPLLDALRHLALPDEYPLRMHTTARTWLERAAQDHPLRQDVTGISKGSALAIVLADYGLGFRPLRRPGEEGVDLVVQPLEDISDPWQIGWELDPRQPRNEIAPALFELITAGFDDVPLQDVLDAVHVASHTPIIIDYRACAERNIDPTDVKVSYPRKQTAWALLIRTVTSQARLTHEIRTDEGGNAFVRVFPFVPTRATQ